MVGDGGFGGQEVAEGCEVGEFEDLGEGVVEAAAGGAVVHGGEALELCVDDLIEEAEEVLTLGRREATGIEDRELL